MKTVRPASFLAFALTLLLPALAWGQAAIYFETNFPPEEFKARWEKVYDAIGPDAIAVVQGMPQVNGFIYPRQNNEFFYLCGVETPHSMIVLDGRTRYAILYMPPRNRAQESAEGRVLSGSDVELVKQLTGADEVRTNIQLQIPGGYGRRRGGGAGTSTNAPGGRGGSTNEADSVPAASVFTNASQVDPAKALPEAASAKTIYTLFSPGEGVEQSRGELNAANRAILSDYWDGRETREQNLAGLLKKRYPQAEVKDFTDILDRMRSIKSKREIDVIRRASQIAALGIMEAMRSTKPGAFEYELDAAARYQFLVNGAKLEGYRSIIGAGTSNIFNMHYYRNTGELRSSDLILMDYAPDYGYYVSDLGRMWPVSGKFLPWQRELLQFVLEYRNAILTRIRPGVDVWQIRAEAQKAMEPILAKTKFSKPAYRRAAQVLVDRGGGEFSHTVGMAVHDDEVFQQGYVSGPLKPGQVFSIDPALRVPEENLYLRYEDVVVVTETGVENFTAFLPSELKDIEKMVGKGGVVQKVPPTSSQTIAKWPKWH